MSDFRVEDESGDRRYFTMVPNYVLNHSSAIDQAVYLQMKRYAGENGSCFASGKTIRKKLKIGKATYNKSVKYLLDHEWIYDKGSVLVETAGGPQMVKVYGLRDLWRMNNDHYSKGGPDETTLQRGGLKIAKGGPDRLKGGSRLAPKKNLKTQEDKFIYDETTKTMRPRQ